MSVWSKFKEASYDVLVAPSYGAAGYRLRSERWPELAPGLMDGKTALVTGANSGIGFATADALSKLGARVIMVCRNRERGEAALRELRSRAPEARLDLEICDVSVVSDVRALVERVLTRHERLDVLVNNAGVVIPTRSTTVDGIEQSFATNVLGGFVLTLGLERALLEARGRVIHVTSGGMYTQRIDLDDPFWERKRYDGVKAYAQTKRAQVILNERFARRWEGTGLTSNAMHPGWAQTPGVQSALPRFERLFRDQLRTPAQGADTVVWLAASPEVDSVSGKLFFDREARKTHVLPWTKDPDGAADRLWALCEALAGERASAR